METGCNRYYVSSDKQKKNNHTKQECIAQFSTKPLFLPQPNTAPTKNIQISQVFSENRYNTDKFCKNFYSKGMVD